MSFANEGEEGMKSKFAFIICYNDPLILSECLYYIDSLNIPEGYEVETITIADAESMASGYNAAMNSTDAKYKVYLHQDVYIVNRDFLSECIRVFESDQQIGMIGLIGCRTLPENVSAYNHWDIGACYSANAIRIIKLSDKHEEEIHEAEAVDGMLMVTAVDLRWREDIFDGWDFYDISQSMEFHKAGFRVVVPYQDKPWCVHDCGASKLLSYDKYRERFCAEYGEKFVYDGDTTVSDRRKELLPLCSALEKRMKQLLSDGQKDQVKNELMAVGQAVLENHNLMMLFTLHQIDDMEKAQGHTISWKDYMTFDELREKWIKLKFILRRIEFDVDENASRYLWECIQNGYYSLEAVMSCIIHIGSEKEALAAKCLAEADIHII